MTVADAVARLTPICLTGATHADYARTVQLAELYRKLATGDIDSLLRPFARRENDFEFATRKKLTVETVSASWNQLRTPFYEMARLRGGAVTKRFDYAETLPVSDAQRFAAKLTLVTNAYYNRKPIEHYLAEKLVKSHCMSDPNAWLLTVFLPFDFRTQVPRPYPVLVPCEAAVDFTREAGDVTSFTARYRIPQSSSAFRYTCYLENQAVDCWPVLWDGNTPTYTLPEGLTVAGVLLDEANNKRVAYQYAILNHRAGQVPATVLGYAVDEAGTGETFVSPLHPAMPFMVGMLKTGSENDVVMAQMATPIRSQYAKPCPGLGRDDEGRIHSCINGLDTATTAKCSVCGGAGQLAAPITALETITVPWPEDGEKVPVKPAEAMAFLGPSAELPKLQLDYLQSRRLLAMQAVHGTEDADRAAGTETATQRRLRQQAQRVALAPAADQLSTLYVHAATTCAAYTDTGQGLTVVYEIPVVEQVSEDELYEQRAAAKKAGADSSTLEAIDSRIALKQFADDPDALAKNQVKRRYITFLGYSIEQVNQLYALGGMTKYNWVARHSADIVFGELEVEVTNFYHLAEKEQGRLVDEKIKKLVSDLPPSSAAMPRMNLSPLDQPVAAAV